MGFFSPSLAGLLSLWAPLDYYLRGVCDRRIFNGAVFA
nr:MAG TPA: hypothetical protein [Caudoviricetes sp.]